MGLHVSLGVARDLSGEPHVIVLPLESPVQIAGEIRDCFYVEPFGFDASLAPPGKSTLKVVFTTSYRYRDELHKSPDRYAQEKARIAETVIDELDKRFSGLRAQVEVIDVATPMTTERFAGSSHGYSTTWRRMTMAVPTGRRLSQTLPGLGNFYMVGQWAGLPGVSLVAAMGRNVVRPICRNEGTKFTTA